MFLKNLIILYKCKFIFKKPKANNLIVFDDTSIEYLKNILYGRKYFTLITRSANLRKIYITPEIIFFSFIYFRGNLFRAYIYALIRIVNPKVILTYIDNSPLYHHIASSLKSKIKFLAIQNAARYEIKIQDYFEKKQIMSKKHKHNLYCIPYFCCFGQHEIDCYKKKKIDILKFKKIGSLKVSNFKKLKNFKMINNRKYDICLISDDAYNMDNFFELKGFEEGFAKLVKYTIKFCIENKKKIIFPLKRYLNQDKNNEINFFKNNLNNEEFNFLIKNSYKRHPKKKYSSFLKMYESNVVLGCATTMLREGLSLRKKVMVCNFSPTKVFDFPLTQMIFLKNPSYFEFEKKLNYFLSLKEKKYFTLLENLNNQSCDYIIENPDKIDANTEINQTLNNMLIK